MRYRVLDPSGDFTFGQGASEFLVNTPETVGQAVHTRLLLAQGEWFLDVTEGTPYATEILGAGTQDIYDQAIRERILGTQGVISIDNYSSFLGANRKLTVSCSIVTVYGVTQLQQVI